MDEQAQKQIALETDFFKDKLKISERARGIANLLNKDLNVIPEKIAKQYGWSMRMVNNLVKLSTLHPKVLQYIDDGDLDAKKATEIARIKREDMQIKVADQMAQHHWFDLTNALERVAFELPFDDVFTYEEAKKDNMVGIVVKQEGEERVFTYDKEYYEKCKNGCEARVKEAYEKTEKKVRENGEKVVDEKQAKEERKKERVKAKDKFDSTLLAFNYGVSAFLKKNPDEKQLSILIDRFSESFCVDNCKLILRAFEVEFKVSEMDSSAFRLKVAEVLKRIVKNEKHLCKLILFVDYMTNIYKTTIFDFDGLKKVIVKLNK